MSYDTNLYKYLGNSPVNTSDPSGNGPLAVSLCMKTTKLEIADQLQELTNEKDETIKQIDEQIRNIQKNSCQTDPLVISELEELKKLKETVYRGYYLNYSLKMAFGSGFAVVYCPLLTGLPGY